MPDSPKVASAAEVRAHRDHPWIVELPESGLAVQIRRVSLLELAAAGRIPDELTTEALSSLAEALEEAREQTAPEAQRTMRRRLDLIDAVCCALLVLPEMSTDSRGGALTPSDLPLGDRIHLYGIAVGSVEGPNLSPFPGGPGADMAPIADGAGLRDQTLDPAGSR